MSVIVSVAPHCKTLTARIWAEIVTARGKNSRDTMLGKKAARAGLSNTPAHEISAMSPYTSPTVALPRSVSRQVSTLAGRRYRKT